MYARFPTLHAEHLVFTSEDDLWSVSVAGGTATRLTATVGAALAPVLSPDGQWLAYLGRDEGSEDVWIMPSSGGLTQRLTFSGGGSLTQPVAWTPDSKCVVTWSSHGCFHSYQTRLWAHPLDGSPATLLPCGIGATEISFSPSGKGSVLGRNTGRGPEREAAWWKRYRGGTVGVLWMDLEGDGQYQPFAQNLPGNLSDAHWLGERIYFLSDHEGINNVYSLSLHGEGLQRHTSSRDLYLRHMSSDGRRLVWMSGGELFVSDPAEEQQPRRLEIRLSSSRTQLQRKFISAADWLESADLHPKSHQLLTGARGKMATLGNWDGAVLSHGQAQGVRYSLPTWLSDGEHFAALSDESGEERLELRHAPTATRKKELADFELGLTREIKASPQGLQVALSNHRSELWFVDMETNETKLVDRSPTLYGLQGFDWSPDGAYLAYAWAENPSSSSIKIWHKESGQIHQVTDGSFHDLRPSFDPEGKYLSFLSHRVFNPVYDSSYFELSFPANQSPFVLVLSGQTPSPFVPTSKPITEAKKDKKDEVPTPTSSTQIDWEGLEQRVLAYPVASVTHNYVDVLSVRGGVVFLKQPIEGSKSRAWMGEDEPTGELEYWNQAEQKIESLQKRVSSLKRSLDGESLLLRSGKRLRLGSAKTLKDMSGKDKEDGFSLQTGWVDLKRVHFEVEPRAEWQQMYNEAWRLQRDYFWDENMCGEDWKAVHARYLPALERVGARSEISDLIWEMHGELGTSHAYEMKGDYRRSPRYPQGHLGADLSWNEDAQAWRIDRILAGDTWDPKATSPLLRSGAGVKEGDFILSLSGIPLERCFSPDRALINRAGEEVLLIIRSKEGGEPRQVSVKALGSEYPLRYREWVEKNRRYVHEASGGRLGYLHIPNMTGPGFSEFHRAWAHEVHRGGLLVDVRYNGGGHVSQLLLEKLARKRIAWDLPRYGMPEPYPSHTVGGPMLALTNEYAGSDGDIFSHGFKLMKLGPLVGKRTWGGVVGIFPQRALVDGTWTTQPQFATWFDDVKWGVENYGSDPDVRVENRPQDDVANQDVQLETGVRLLLEALEKSKPVVPDFTERPDFSAKITLD